MRGSIQKRTGKNGKIAYMVRVEFPGDQPGERKQRAKTFHSEKEAERQLAKWLTEIDQQTAVEPSKITVADLAQKWLYTVAAHKVKPTTLEDYRATIDRHILPALGKIQAQRLTPATVQQFYADKLAGGTGARTVQLCHQRLSQVLEQGVRWGLLVRNVCDVAEPPRATPKDGQAWTPEEAQRFLAASQEDTYHPFWLVALATGMRRGELLGLRWEDIDFEQRTATVAQAVALLDGKPVIQTPKTRAAKREVKLPAEAVAALKRHQLRQTEHRWLMGDRWHPNGLVFCTGEGKPLNPNNLYRNANAIMERAGVPRIRLHDMRHTHATMLLKNGQPLKVLSERLGHSRASVTLDRYAHVLPGMQEAAANAVDDLLFRRAVNE